jgi:hypothetical protein
MSLLRLLAAGKSLMGLKDPRGRFEVTEKRLLPKFEAAKNPFRATTLPHGKPEDREPLPLPEPEPAEASAFGSGAGAPANPPAPPVPQARARSLWERAGEKCRGTWPFNAGKKQEIRAVQPELSLDLVRVVRNDLTDSDAPDKPKKAEGAALRTLHKGADAVRALEKSARDLLQACKL